MSLKTLDAITRIRTTLYFQSKYCKDFSVTERMFEVFTTENMYQFDHEGNRNSVSEGQERQEDVIFKMTVDCCHCLNLKICNCYH